LTCIVATPSWLCADRRVTGDGSELSSMVKVAKNRWLIGAAAGAAVSTMAVKRAIQKGASTVEDMIEHVDKDSYALILTPDGKIHRIETGIVWPCSAGAVQAIGSGGEFALGFLAGAAPVGWPSRADAKRAQRAVARARTDCGGGVDFRGFADGKV
jgi:hypothetical protein